MTPAELQQLFHGDAGYIRLRSRPSLRPAEIREILLEDRLWFSSITDQDDIYEGRPLFRWREQPVELEAVRELSRRHLPWQPDHVVEAHVELVMARMGNPRIAQLTRNEYQAALTELYGSSSIACFFRDPVRQGHWASYADRGRGYGLVFDFSHPWNMVTARDMEPIEAVPFPVTYVPLLQRPVIELSFEPTDPGSAFEDLKAALLSKSDEWFHQQEERIFRAGIPAGHVIFPPDSLRALILGYAMNAEDRESVLAAVAARRSPLALFEVVPGAEDYRLELRAVETV